MKLEQSFEVAAPVERVWKALIDVEQVAPCLPGAAVTGRNEDGSYSGAFTVKIGPTTASYTGKLRMEAVDEESHTATMSAQGSDKRGQGGATATIVSKLEAIGDQGTRVEVDTEYHITGRLARFGRSGMIEDISERLLKEFAQRLAQSLEGTGQESATVEIPAQSDEAIAPAPTDAPEPPAGEASPPPVAEAAPMDAGSLVGGVLLDRVKANPWPWLGGLLLILLLRRRRR
jgi:carbon monoxide dehydrogenase subunit G